MKPEFSVKRAIFVALSASCLWFAAAGPATAVETDDLVAVFKSGTHVYVEENAEPVDEAMLNKAVDDAAAMGFDFYIAVLSADSANVNNKQVREALSDVTVATWTPDTYRISSADVCEDALNRADNNAKASVRVEYPPDVFMTTFVAALGEARGLCDGGGSGGGGLPGWLRTLLVVVAIAAAGLLILWAYQRGQDRAAQLRRDDEFDERRKVLKDWAETLQGPVESLQGPVEASGNTEYQTMLEDAKKVAENAETEIDEAKALPDLDRAEIRIARAQMRVRDLYEALPDVSR